MSGDRYLKAVLTIIAIELAYLGVIHTATPVTAQQPQQEPTPVVITGIRLGDTQNFLPVGILGEVGPGSAGSRGASATPLRVTVRDDQPLRVSVPLPLDVRTVTPIRIDADRPIKVENVGYVGTPQPR
jgi:hypothetical protein